MANVTIEITNDELFDKKVIDIDCSSLKGTVNYKNELHIIRGDLCLELENGEGWATTTGKFGIRDYEEELGFIFVEDLK